MPFTPKFVDLVRNFTTVQGAGPVTLGAAVSGYTSIAAAMSAGDQFYYCIQSVDRPQEREVGRGTMRPDGKIDREAIAGGLTTFSSGTKTIALVAAAEWFEKVDQAGAGASIEAAARSELAAAPSSRGPALLTEPDREGLFVFDPADLSARVALDTAQGIYVPPASDPSGASGAWVRQFDGDYELHWFGAVADDATDILPAFNAATALLEADGVTVPYGLGTRGLHIRKGNYYCSGALVPQQLTRLHGDGGKGSAGGSATVIRFPAGTHGIDLKPEIGVRAPGIHIYGIELKGPFASGNEGEFHGINADVSFKASDCFIHKFAGDGIHVTATAVAGNGFLENANGFVIEDVWVQECRRGLYVQGADSNAGRVSGFNGVVNRQWAVSDDSFLGNVHIAPHAATNARLAWNSGAANRPCSYVSHNGHRYFCIRGQEAWCAANAPSGTTADNLGWGYWMAGGPDASTGVPAWTSGITVRAGGAFCFIGDNNNATLLGPYAEADQPPSQIDDKVLTLNARNATCVRVVPSLGAFTRLPNTLTADGAMVFGGRVDVNGPLTANHANNWLGPITGPPADTLFRFNTTNFQVELWFSNWNAGVESPINKVQGSWGFGAIYDVFNTGYRHAYRINGSAVLDISAAGLNLQAGKVVTVGGTQVLGARGAAVADATDAASAITQLNALLARCRAHGLIAT